jgi:hypothetical protein
MEGLLVDYPDSIPVRRRLAEAFRNAGKTSEAIYQFDLIGESLLQAGDRSGAIQAIETIIALSPPNKREYIALLEQLRRQQV